MDASESMWVNKNYIWYGVNLLRLGGLHVIFKWLVIDEFHEKEFYNHKSFLNIILSNNIF